MFRRLLRHCLLSRVRLNTLLATPFQPGAGARNLESLWRITFLREAHITIKVHAYSRTDGMPPIPLLLKHGEGGSVVLQGPTEHWLQLAAKVLIIGVAYPGYRVKGRRGTELPTRRICTPPSES